MIKMSILWDEKNSTDLSSEDMQKRLSKIITDYQKEIPSSSDAASIFVGLATGSDKELLHILINLPSEIRLKLLEYIQSCLFKEVNPKKPSLKKLLLTSPHKDLEIPIHRSTETGREIQGWDF